MINRPSTVALGNEVIAQRTLWRQVLRRIDWRTVFALILLTLMICSALLAEVISPHDPTQIDLKNKLAPPAWLPGGIAHYPLGTDALGRDLLSRLVYGSRISITIGVTAMAIGATAGTILGMIAGFYGKAADSIIMRIADIQLAFPFVLLAIAVIGVVGPSFTNLVIILGLASWMTYARVIRGEVLSIREREYIMAARVIGVSNAKIIFRHILPNLVHVVLVIATLEVGRMIIMESALSFLGLGIQPPDPTWGGMLNESQEYIGLAWWLTTWPGLAIVGAVLAINLLGDWLRDALDPRSW
jgi:peptide/nickel transport system permease protein